MSGDAKWFRDGGKKAQEKKATRTLSDFYDDDWSTEKGSIFNDPVYESLVSSSNVPVIPKQKELGFSSSSKTSSSSSSSSSSGTTYSWSPGPDKTSKTDPIRVDQLRLEGYKGLLGATFCPGKKNRSGRNGPWWRDLDSDLLRMRMEYEIDVLVCLVEAKELQDVKVQDLLWKAQEYHMRPIWYPIVDTETPSDMPSFIRLIEKLAACIKRGRKLAVHCMGGIGRTGTVNAAICIALGFEPEQAIKMARQMRSKALENVRQENFIKYDFPMAWKFTRPILKRDRRRDK